MNLKLKFYIDSKYFLLKAKLVQCSELNETCLDMISLNIHDEIFGLRIKIKKQICNSQNFPNFNSSFIRLCSLCRGNSISRHLFILLTLSFEPIPHSVQNDVTGNMGSRIKWMQVILVACSAGSRI